MANAVALADTGFADRLRGLKQPYKFFVYLALTLIVLAIIRWVFVALFPESVYPFLTEPFEKIYADWPSFFFEVVISGVLTGVMYALVALGFVLIFKASGMFNFAQGIMVLFAALMLVGLMGMELKIAMTTAVWIVYPIIAIAGIALLGVHFARTRSAAAADRPAPASPRMQTMRIVGYALFYWGAGLGIIQLLTESGPSTGWTLAYSVAIVAVAAFFLLRAWGRVGAVTGVQSISEAGRIVMGVTLFIGIVLVIVAIWSNRIPTIIALPLTVIVMIALARVVEALILRHLVNQHEIILFMATIGLAFFLVGFGETLWGGNVRKLDVGLPQGNWQVGGMLLQQFEIAAAVIGAVLVAFLAFFFQKTKIGRALRAVADDHQAALSLGISLRTIWIFVWSTAGIVALVAGIVWGGKSGVQFSLSLIALKALPVLILGGLTSIPGAIVGGLIIGVGEKVAEVYWGPAVGGAIENWFAFVLALVFLMFRPQGLFGERIIERV